MRSVLDAEARPDVQRCRRQRFVPLVEHLATRRGPTAVPRVHQPTHPRGGQEVNGGLRLERSQPEPKVHDLELVVKEGVESAEPGEIVAPDHERAAVRRTQANGSCIEIAQLLTS